MNTYLLHMFIMYIHCVQKTDQQHFVHNFENFKCIAVLFAEQHPESNAILPMQPVAYHR